MTPTVTTLPPFMTDDQFVAFFNRTAKAIFEQRGEIAPSWLLSFDDRAVLIVTPWTNPHEKHHAFNVIKEAAKLNKPRIMGFTCEVGYKVFEKDQVDDMNLAREVGINILPDKLDALVIQTQVPGQKMDFHAFEVKDGKVIKEIDWEGSRFKGPLADFFA